MSVPNIFSFATKELTQDALICWLIACAKDGSGVYQARGLEFISTLYRHDRSPDGENCDISEVGSPERQKHRVDVYFQASINRKKVSFLIEDKVGASMHSGQLARYLKAVQGDKEPEDEIKAIYFKTGHVFDDEREKAQEREFCVFTGKDMRNFLNRVPLSDDHEILCQYRRYLSKKLDKRDRDLEQPNFHEDFVQWDFLKRLRDSLEGCHDEWDRYIDEPQRKEETAKWIWQRLARGKNNGGAPWTQYRFSRHLYWRLDPWYPLRLRVATGAANKTVEEFDARMWNNWISEFKRLQIENDLPALRFTRRMHYKRKLAREGSVGAIDLYALLKKGVSVDECLRRIARFHVVFLKHLQAYM